jgi:hypothetical protein
MGRAGRGFGFGPGQGTRNGGLQRGVFGFEFFADLGADAGEVGARGLHVALTEGQTHTLGGLGGNRHATACGVQADDVAHQHVAAKVAAAPHGVAAGLAQADQRGAHGVDRGLQARALGLVDGDAQVGLQHVQRRATVELQQHAAIHLGDGAHRRHGRGALGHSRDQVHARAKGHA